MHKEVKVVLLAHLHDATKTLERERTYRLKRTYKSPIRPTYGESQQFILFSESF